jgi:hypothetical protein
MIWLSEYKTFELAYAETQDAGTILFGDKDTPGLIHDISLTDYALSSDGPIEYLNYALFGELNEYSYADILAKDRLFTLVEFIYTLKVKFPGDYKSFMKLQVLAPNYLASLHMLYCSILHFLYLDKENMSDTLKSRLDNLYAEEYGGEHNGFLNS